MIARRAPGARRGEPGRVGEMFLAAFLLAVWAIYFRAYWSAGTKRGDLTWLRPETLFSLRYVSGAVGLGEVFLLGLLAGRCPRPLPYALVLTSLASRMAIALGRSWPPLTGFEQCAVVACAGALILAAFWAAGRVRRPGVRRALGWGLAALAVAVLIPGRYEVQRGKHWPQSFRPVWESTARLPKGPVYFCTSRNGPDPALYHHVVTGGRFDRRFVPRAEDRLAAGGLPANAYVVRVSDIYHSDLADPAAERALRSFEGRMQRLGYETVASNRFCTLMRPAPARRVAASRDGGPIR
jgi:hypothetical protein